MLKTMLLLFSIILSIDCRPVRREVFERQILKEIIKILTDTEKHIITPDCKKTMVMDIFSKVHDQNASEVFCKAARSLQSATHCPIMHKNVQKLQLNLLRAGEKATNCTLKMSQTDLTNVTDFLKELLRFSRKTYSSSKDIFNFPRVLESSEH